MYILLGSTPINSDGTLNTSVYVAKAKDDGERGGKAIAFLKDLHYHIGDSISTRHYGYKQAMNIKNAVRDIRSKCRAKDPIRYWLQRINPCSNAYKIESLADDILSKITEFKKEYGSYIKKNDSNPFKFFHIEMTLNVSFSQLDQPDTTQPNLRFMYYCETTKRFFRVFDNNISRDSTVLIPIWVDTKRSAVRLLKKEEIVEHFEASLKDSSYNHFQKMLDFQTMNGRKIINGIRNKF